MKTVIPKDDAPAYLMEAAAHEQYEVTSLIEWILDPEMYALSCPDEVRIKARRARDAIERFHAAVDKFMLHNLHSRRLPTRDAN